MIIFYLKDCLKELNISQNKFARQSGIRPNTINDLCNNKTKRIEICTLEKIMSTLNSISSRVFLLEEIIKYEEEKIS